MEEKEEEEEEEGVNNVSLTIRGLNQLRESLHSVFLYHAIQNGLSMGICEAWLPTWTSSHMIQFMDCSYQIHVFDRTA